MNNKVFERVSGKLFPKIKFMKPEFADIEFILPDKASFFTDEAGFLQMKRGDECLRVEPHRAFPHNAPYKYISIFDTDRCELGIIEDLDAFDKASADALKAELERKYFSLKLLSIESIKEQFGFTTWKVTTDRGKRTFVMRDTFSGIIKPDGGKLIIVDIDGNRYTVDGLESLDKKSRRRIELYI